jgi:hypothetical protein
MMADDDVEVLLALDGARFEAAADYVVEFKASRTEGHEAKTAWAELCARFPAF